MHPEILAPATASCFKNLSPQVWLKHFYLAGGTAVALHLGHRQSVDLDFFSEQSIDTFQLRQNLSSMGKFILEQESPGTLHGVLDDVKVSFLEYSYPHLEALQEYEGLKLAGIRDLAAMKLDAIGSRGKKRDFFDVYALAQEGVSLREMLRWFEAKYASLEYNPMHLIKSLTYFDDAEADPNPVLLKPWKWEQVKGFFRREAMKLV